MNTASESCGKVYLVGAGPGAPGLITVRGVECLQAADVILYDYLVNPVLTQYANSAAELICLGKHGAGTRFWTQDEVNQQLVELARDGKTVVRLKGGDPAVFARGGEEVAYLVEHGIPLEIVPGITAALAAGSHAGISITHRNLASAVALVTGHERADKSPDAPGFDFEGLAKFPGTIVFYMGVTTVGRWSSGLLAGGMPPETPVAVIRRCSRPDQRRIRCRLDEVEERLTPRTKFPPPAIAIVGSVADQPLIGNWFEERPLFGQTVLVTRPVGQASEMVSRFSALGADVVAQPTIEIRPLPEGSTSDKAALDAVSRLNEYGWIVFSSRNGVDHFMWTLRRAGMDARALGSLRLATIGPATTSALEKWNLVSDLQPQQFDSDHFAQELIEAISAQNSNRQVLSVRANRGSQILQESLAGAGITVDEVAFYENRDVESLSPDVLQRCDEGEIDWITVTSSATATNLVRLLGVERLKQVRLASISPITSAQLRELGLEPAVEATESTMDGLIDALVKA